MRFLSFLMVVVWMGSLAWLFWAVKIDGAQSGQAVVAVALLFLGLTFVIYSRARARAPKARKDGAERAADLPVFDLDAHIAEVEARPGTADRAASLPGWALMMRSPWKESGAETSWLGGLPFAPADFAWPRDGDGHALRFLMQVDLAALTPEPQNGQRPPGLPAQGALLVFVGWRHYAAIVLSPEQMANAIEIAAPDEGFSPEDRVFAEGSLPRWPVDPVAYIDRDGGRPPFLPVPRSAMPDWLDTWGIAKLEAGIAAKALTNDIRMGKLFFEQRERVAQAEAAKPVPLRQRLWALLRGRPVRPPVPVPPHKQHELAYREIVRQEGAALLAEIEGFAARAATMPASDPVNAEELAEIFRKRTALAQRIEACVPGKGTYGIALDLAGRVRDLLRRLQQDYPGLRSAEDLASIPVAYRGFLEAVITDWRGHRLFGLEAPPPHNTEDLRGHDCLFTVTEDAILQFQTEHDYGVSVWCPRDAMGEGRFDGGQVLWHSNG